jgi:rhodanese-related sulfurtransferase
MTLNFLYYLHSFRFYNLLKIPVLTIVLSISFGGLAIAQPSQNIPRALDKRDNWEAKDLIEPSVLASMLNDKKAKQPVIFNIGVVEDILGSKNVGAASKKENSDRLKENLKGLRKNTLVVVYCGCCPFDKCPNIRPAFGMLKSMGFSNGKLLNIPNNLKQNWISKGYPMMSSHTR